MLRKIFVPILLGCCLFLFQVPLLRGGWCHDGHINFIREAIRILPVFDYNFCRHYQHDMVKGVIEGEFHYRYLEADISPNWFENVAEEDLIFLQGCPVDSTNMNEGAVFFTRHLNRLREDLKKLTRRNSEILFDLAGLIQSINNICIPLYDGEMGENHFVKHTEGIVLDTERIERIENLESWLSGKLGHLLAVRYEWSRIGRTGDRESFREYSYKAIEQMIYTSASIIIYVLDNCFGPADPVHRDEVAGHHLRHMKIVNGRKPGIGGVH